jgi:hypothetical protein
VDTTNFTPKQTGNGTVTGPGNGSTVPRGISFGNFHVTEYFVPLSADRIQYYATIDDPTTWISPWTFMLNWDRDDGYKILEYACVEGNISIENALRGERAAGR